LGKNGGLGMNKKHKSILIIALGIILIIYGILSFFVIKSGISLYPFTSGSYFKSISSICFGALFLAIGIWALAEFKDESGKDETNEKAQD